LRGQKASRFVDSEAGRSSGSEADDDAEEEDDEVGSIDGFVVKDEEATSSNYESDSEEEVKTASRLTRLRRGRDSIELDAEAAAEAQLGRSLRGLSIMRIEAVYARDVVDGTKTLELTKSRCHTRGVVLVAETAARADHHGCAIGAVTLGDCKPMSRREFDEVADRHRASNFAPAQTWLEAGSLHSQELDGAVRFETPVPYRRKKGTRKWLRYQPPVTLLTEQRRAMLKRLNAVRQRIKRCKSVSTLQQTEEPLQQLETALAAVHDGASSEEGGGEGGEEGGGGAGDPNRAVRQKKRGCRIVDSDEEGGGGGVDVEGENGEESSGVEGGGGGEVDSAAGGVMDGAEASGEPDGEEGGEMASSSRHPAEGGGGGVDVEGGSGGVEAMHDVTSSEDGAEASGEPDDEEGGEIASSSRHPADAYCLAMPEERRVAPGRAERQKKRGRRIVESDAEGEQTEEHRVAKFGSWPEL